MQIGRVLEENVLLDPDDLVSFEFLVFIFDWQLDFGGSILDGFDLNGGLGLTVLVIGVNELDQVGLFVNPPVLERTVGEDLLVCEDFSQQLKGGGLVDILIEMVLNSDALDRLDFDKHRCAG